MASMPRCRAQKIAHIAHTDQQHSYESRCARVNIEANFWVKQHVPARVEKRKQESGPILYNGKDLVGREVGISHMRRHRWK